MEEIKKITIDSNNELNVPDYPIIPFIEGDGIGPDIWNAAKRVIDSAVATVYKNKKKIHWQEVFAGEKGYKKTGEWLSDEAIKTIEDHVVAIKGPLTTPVGKGIRSINVAIRQKLDLYACVRPVRYIDGVPSPMRYPESLNMVIYRENTEDVYAGHEWEAGSDEAKSLTTFLRENLGAVIPDDAGIGIKPISKKNTKRLVTKAIIHAIENGFPSVTFMHKGNIMKFTEGAFAKWGYEVAKEDFGSQTITETELYDYYNGIVPHGKIVIRDRIADMLFQQVLLRPDEYHVIATSNLNGDYLSDAIAAQVGGLGMAPGANIGDRCAVFEATHGTAPKYANLDKVNPGSLILSGAMMMDYLGWEKAGDLIQKALQDTIKKGFVTYDLARQIKGAKEVSCSMFAEEIIKNMG